MIVPFLLLLIFSLHTSLFASPGDKHYAYRACLNHCQQINCSTPLGFKEFQIQQTFFEYLFQWSCPDECAYQCMWKALSQLPTVVQFHGNPSLSLSNSRHLLHFRQMAIYPPVGYSRACFRIILDLKLPLELFLRLSSSSSTTSLQCSSVVFHVVDILPHLDECVDLVDPLSYPG